MPRAQVGRRHRPVGRPGDAQVRPGKEFGYIILPIGDPRRDDAGAGAARQQAVRRRLGGPPGAARPRRAVRRDGQPDRPQQAATDKINVIGVTGGHERTRPSSRRASSTSSFPDLDELARRDLRQDRRRRSASARYWEDWAKDVADIADRPDHPHHGPPRRPETGRRRSEFDRFLAGLRGNLNDSITRDDAIEMLAQHLITRPVFDALFDGLRVHRAQPGRADDGATCSPRSTSTTSRPRPRRSTSSTTRSAMRVEGIDTAEGKQQIITELYDKFFTTAFTKTADKLGIVYTPVEIVDFILRSADDVLQRGVRPGLTDEGVHVLDAFTGTGTFIVRLLQSGLIEPHDLARKYADELHANEILLLAYYIAAVNIETTYPRRSRERRDPATSRSPGSSSPTPSSPRRTTTASTSTSSPRTTSALERPEATRRSRVIVGNPPYSVGPGLAPTTTTPTTSTRRSTRDPRRPTPPGRRRRYKNSLYDSYIRAIQWASVRIEDRGVIAFVTNGGYLDSNTADGMRKTLAESSRDLRLQPARQPAHRRRAVAQGGRQGLRRRHPGHRRDHGSRSRSRASTGAGDGPLPRHRRLPHSRAETRHRRPRPNRKH